MSKSKFPAYDATMTIAELTAIHNDRPGISPVKKFKDKPTALARLDALRAAGESKPTRPRGVGETCRRLLSEGVKPKEVLAAALAEHPTARTTMACVYWYAKQLRGQA